MPETLFKDRYYYLNPMFPCQVKITVRDQEILFLSAESAFQALKHPTHVEQIAKMTGYDARVFAMDLQEPPDWFKHQDEAMRLVQKAKFEQNPRLLAKLKALDKDIVFDNFWSDTYWGRSGRKGMNKLGFILTEIKQSL